MIKFNIKFIFSYFGSQDILCSHRLKKAKINSDPEVTSQNRLEHARTTRNNLERYTNNSKQTEQSKASSFMVYQWH